MACQPFTYSLLYRSERNDGCVCRNKVASRRTWGLLRGVPPCCCPLPGQGSRWERGARKPLSLQHLGMCGRILASQLLQLLFLKQWKWHTPCVLWVRILESDTCVPAGGQLRGTLYHGWLLVSLGLSWCHTKNTGLELDKCGFESFSDVCWADSFWASVLLPLLWK